MANTTYYRSELQYISRPDSWTPRAVVLFPPRRLERRRPIHGEERLRRNVPAFDEGPASLLGGGRRGHLLGQALGPCLRRLAQALLPLVHRRRAQHLLQRARRSRGSRPRQATGARLRQPRDWHAQG